MRRGEVRHIFLSALILEATNTLPKISFPTIPHGACRMLPPADVKVRGVVAAKDGMMGKSQQNSMKQPNTSRNAGRNPGSPATGLSRRGGKPRSRSRRRKAEPKPGEGAEWLRCAIDKLVGQECGRIAKALVEKTIAGNMTGARLLVELSGAKNPLNRPVKKRRGPTLAQQLAAEPQWTGPWPGEEETGAPAFERSAATTSS